MNTSSPDTQRTRHELARWTEGDDSHGAGAARAYCGHCTLSILRPPRSGPQRVRMSSGDRPIGAAKGKRPNTEALYQTPPPPSSAGSGVQSTSGQ